LTRLAFGYARFPSRQTESRLL